MRNIYFKLTMLFIFFISTCTASHMHLNRGKEYLNEKHYEQAILELENATKEDVNVHYLIDAYSYLGDAYAESGKITEAISSYKSAMQMIRTRMQEIFTLRKELRDKIKFKSAANVHTLQEKEDRLSEENQRLKEKGGSIKSKMQNLVKKR